MEGVKAQVRELFFGHDLKCFFCGTAESVSIAHIVNTGEANYSEFGRGAGYIGDLDVFSARNFIPLCGRHGQRDSCHDAFDRYLVAIMYNPLATRYFLLCADDAPERLRVLSSDPDHALHPPDGWTPYHRLLAWRAQQSAIDHRYDADVDQLLLMNHLSETAESVGSNGTSDADFDFNADADADADARVKG